MSFSSVIFQRKSKVPLSAPAHLFVTSATNKVKASFPEDLCHASVTELLQTATTACLSVTGFPTGNLDINQL